MQFRFVGNACGVFETHAGTKILMDPWLIDGVFEGSWYHYPPVSSRPKDFHDVDAIYVSHIHPDHFDERHFDFPKEIPIIALKSKFPFLVRKLKEMGHDNIIEIADGETVQFRDAQLTMYEPFTTHPFHEAEIGNVIDSALVIEADGQVAVNTNDNTPDLDSARSLRERHGAPDLLMLNYNAAGPYPACFQNLSPEEKRTEHDDVLDRNMRHMVDIVGIMEPRILLPFAGAYILGGAQSPKNAFLGTTTWDACQDFVEELGVGETVVRCMREGSVMDLSTSSVSPPYERIDPNHMAAYIASVADAPYPHESDRAPDLDRLKQDLAIASEKMVGRAARLGLSARASVAIVADSIDVQVLEGGPSDPVLRCSLDARLLRRILDRVAHWNNAEIGCHIDFVRKPNEYQPDIHTMLQFLHL